MKAILKILINSIVFLIVGPGDGVNFSHRNIRKDIERTYGISEYRTIELESICNTASNGEVLGKYFRVDAPGVSRYIYVGRVFTCPAGGCDKDINSTQTSEYFDYLLLLDANNEVKQVSVVNYQATHGQGICSRGWLKQFVGAGHTSALIPGKTIDAISGATRSVSAISADVSTRLKELNRYQTGQRP